MKLIITALFILSVLFVGPQCEADAAVLSPFLTCSVEMAGPAGPAAANGIVVYLTIRAGNPYWANSASVKYVGAMQKEFLATALTAMANGKLVYVRITNPATANRTLYSISLTTQDIIE